jgi:hypothetical protein
MPSLSKADGSGLATKPNVVGSGCQARPETLPKGVIAMGVAGQADPKHFKKMLARPIDLGFGCPARPIDLGSSCATIPKDIRSGSGCFALFSDLNLFFIQ